MMSFMLHNKMNACMHELQWMTIVMDDDLTNYIKHVWLCLCDWFMFLYSVCDCIHMWHF